MYHSNRREKQNRSKDKLYVALTTLIQSKSYDAISIQSLTKKAGISRSTFYRNYQRIDEILLSKIDFTMLAFSEYIMDYSKKYSGGLDFPFYLIMPALEFWACEYELLDVLLKIDRLQWIQTHFQQNSILENINNLYLKDLSTKDVTYIQKLGFSIIFNTISLWIAGGRTETPEYLGKLILEHLFSIDLNTEDQK